MGKIYTMDGSKMGLAEICGEVIAMIHHEDAELLTRNIEKYDYKDSQMKLAHGILDSYKYIESTSDYGARLRKLLDNLMNKYQKSVGAVSNDDKSLYHNLIVELGKC